MCEFDDEQAAIAELEVENGLRQYDFGVEVIRSFTEDLRPFRLTPGLISEFQKIAVQGILRYPGAWRTGNAEITKSKHIPPGPHLIQSQVQELCDYVNDNWHESSAFHLSAYAMWRHNWIHPFPDGNGRTSRMLSYVVLSTKLGYLLPGARTIPQQIQDDRTLYFSALEAADRACLDGAIDVSAMENLIKNMLANQLLAVIEEADGDGMEPSDE